MVAMLRKRFTAAIGDRLRVRWNEEHVLLFDAQSGRRLV
jgi:hypothetical protein